MSNSISPRTNKIVNVVISLGAAVVLVGALAKIIHLSWADYALIVGLLTEALIFVIYAFLPPPEMGGGSSDAASGTTDAILAKLEAAKIDQAAFDKLSTSFGRYCRYGKIKQRICTKYKYGGHLYGRYKRSHLRGIQ